MTEAVDRGVLDEIHRASAEAAAGHAGAVNAGQIGRGRDQQVEFRATHLEVVA